MKSHKSRREFSKRTNSIWEYPACDNCGGLNLSTFFDNVGYWQHKGKFRIVRCDDCGLIFVYPRPTLSEITKYYPKESYWGQDIEQQFLLSDWKKQRAKGYSFLYRLLSQYLPMNSILDIGAGTGVFLSWFKEKGWKTAGVELSSTAVKFAHKVFGLNIKQGDFLGYRFPKNSFDVVTLNNVLEHLHQPKRTLSAIHQVLKPNGLVVITVPNIESIGISLFGKTSHLLQPPRHLYHFSEHSLRSLLNKAGFTVLGIDHGYWEHNYYSVFESFRLTFSPRFKQSLSQNRWNQLVNQNSVQIRFSPIKELIKIMFKILTLCIVITELLLKRSEVICVYARKK